MNQVQINDIRGFFMILFLFAGVVLTIRSAFINTAKRILWTYRWKGVRYRQLMALSGCLFFSTLAIGCLDDAQRIATAGSSFSNWFATGPLPAAAYHYAVLFVAAAMLPFNFAQFLYKMYHTEKGNPDAGILAEIMILTALPVVMVMAHYSARVILFLLNGYHADDPYGISASVKAGLFLLSAIYFLYDAYTVKKGFACTKPDVKKKVHGPMVIWEEKTRMHGVKKAGTEIQERIRCVAEMLYWRIKHGK